MGLNTSNASGLTGSKNPADRMFEVEVLIGTRVACLERDVKPGEIVEVTFDDYRFLKAYNYVKDVEKAEEVKADKKSGKKSKKAEAETEPAATETDENETTDAE